MDVERFYVKRDNTVEIKCPYCRTSRTVHTEKFKNNPKKILKVRCLCRKIFNVVLEFRKMNRKETKLKGRYVNQSRDNDEGGIFVNNLSMNGVGFYTVSSNKIKKDNILNVKYRIDDAQKTFISREVIVRRVVKGNNFDYVGAESVNVGEYDKYLDFYLLPE
jgi:hypothetical protein